MSGNARQFLGYDDERTTGAALSLLRDTEVGKMATIPLLVDGEAEEGGSVEGTEGAGPRGYTFLLSAILPFSFSPGDVWEDAAWLWGRPPAVWP